VLNGYGALDTERAATIIADLTGQQCKWVRTPQDKHCLEVDTASGYLVAPASTLKTVTKIDFSYPNHERFDADKFIQKGAA
jgi:hypothetical protein